MIKNLLIENIQSHKKSSFEFSPGVNVLVGLSDGGKSAVLRAIRWLIKNRPQGDGLRSHWGGNSIVALETDTSKITRLRTKSENGYILQRLTDKSDIEFKAIGTEVPEEIQLALNFNDINTQQQLDHPFLLDSTPGEVAAHFNKVAHLDVISNSTKLAQSWVDELDRGIKAKKRQLEEDREKIKQYSYIDEMEGKIAVLENMDSELLQMIVRETKIMNTIESIKDAGGEIMLYKRITEIEPLVDGVLDLIRKKQEIDADRIDLRDGIRRIDLNEDAIYEQNSLIKIEPLVSSVVALMDKKKELGNKAKDLDALLDKMFVVDRDFNSNNEYLKQVEEKFHDEFPDVCPLCGKDK